MKNKFLLLFIALFYFVNLQAQITIKGIIKDSETKAAIEVVTVYLPELNLVKISNINGEFAFDNLAKNSLIEISKKNYTSVFIDLRQITASKNISIQSDGNTFSLEILLERSPIEIKEVLLLGKNESKREVISHDAIKLDDMVKNGNLNVSDALAQIPGVTVSTYSTGIMRPVIRGLSGNRILTVINGTRLENQQWDPEHSYGLTQYGMGQVEVLKGPASFLYGSDAMGGVIRFVDEKPAALNTISTDVSTGFMSNTFGTNSGVSIRGAKEKVSWGFAAGINNHSDYYNGNFDRVANSRFREITTKLNVDFHHKKSLTQVLYLFNLGYYGIVEPFEKDTAGAVEEEDHPMEFETPYHTMMHHLLSVKHSVFFNHAKLMATVSYQNDNRKELEKNDTEENSYLGLNLNNVFVDVKYEQNISKPSTLTIGVNSSLTNNVNQGYGRIIPDYNQIDAGVYLFNQNKIFNNKLHVDIGLRYDQRQIKSDAFMKADTVTALEKTFDNFSGSIGANVELYKNTLLFANIGNGFRAPNAAELTSNGVRMETQRFERGNNNFTKETNVMSELGLSWGNKNLDLSATVFSNSIAGYIYIVPTADSTHGQQIYQYKQADANINGMEFKAVVHPRKLNWMEIQASASILQGNQTNGQALAQMPPYRLNHAILLRKKSFYNFKNTFLKIGLVSVLAQNNVETNELTTPAYNIVNLNFGGDIVVYKQNIQVTVGANNLLNEVYFDHLSAQRKYGVYNMGINGYIALKWSFLAAYKTK